MNNWEEQYKKKVIANKKKQKTTLERYGVPFGYIKNNKKNKSKGNDEFAKLLDVCEIEYQREFILGEYLYDFRIGDILVEISPSITHNSSQGLYNNPKPYLYHQNKTLYALDNGFACINIWDWDDKVEIVKKIKHQRISYENGTIYFDELLNPNLYKKLKEEYETEILLPRVWYYDLEENCLTDENNTESVVIFDSGGIKIK